MNTLFSRLAAGLALTLAAAAAGAVTLPGPVVDTAWLAANLDQVQVVDVRSNPRLFTSQPEFEKDAKTGKPVLTEPGGHIAGARLIDMKTMRITRLIGGMKVDYMIPEKAEFERLLRAAGIDDAKPIVLVPVGQDVTDIDDVLRVYWQLKVYGEDKVAVLDGGLSAWLAEGRAVSSEAAPQRSGSWTAAADRSARYVAVSDDVAGAMARHDATLVDSRDLRQFHGLVKRDYVAAYGHLAGAHLYPTELLMKGSGGALRFQAPATYAALFEAQQIDPRGPAITYCNSGHLAAGTWFVLSELLGNA